ncbi:hypothetical protein [Methylobacterium platani]|uniref:Uncharacterized protein n=1 Tax=Methylobacterium platani TaxID=427683 RepID=A0A179SFX1_9HYPH|nr:hypothetical protein [Methylobacterium platani]OAS26342.1 hypothetical protein A5481_06400 [Methylobacterium platani]
MTCAYILPRRVLDLLEPLLTGLRNAGACMVLARFLARVQAAPSTLGRAFPVDRRALAAHPDLDLTEEQVRSATAALERVGFLARVETVGSPYRATAAGVRRKPVLRKIGAAFQALFRLIHITAQKRRPRENPVPPKTPQAIAVPMGGEVSGLEAALARLAGAVLARGPRVPGEA